MEADQIHTMMGSWIQLCLKLALPCPWNFSYMSQLVLFFFASAYWSWGRGLRDPKN